MCLFLLSLPLSYQNQGSSFDHQNKSLSHDTRIKTNLQAFKCASLAKFGMKGSALFLPLCNTKPGETSTHLQFFKAKKIAKVAPSFLKMVQGNEEGTWFKMQVWMVQYHIQHFKESDSAIIDEHDPGCWGVVFRVCGVGFLIPHHQ
jgi:hypothetical protein